MKYTFSHHTPLLLPRQFVCPSDSYRCAPLALCALLLLSALHVILFSSEVHLRIPSNCKAKSEQRKWKRKTKTTKNKAKKTTTTTTTTMEPNEAAATKSNWIRFKNPIRPSLSLSLSLSDVVIFFSPSPSLSLVHCWGFFSLAFRCLSRLWFLHLPPTSNPNPPSPPADHNSFRFVVTISA